jgi:hypothetical protein
MTTERAAVPLHDPKAQLERALREEYLRDQGHDETSLQALPPERRMQLLRDLAHYVAIRLAEVDARATYVHDIHGASSSE